jgi:hypothetical protein
MRGRYTDMEYFTGDVTTRMNRLFRNYKKGECPVLLSI